MGSWRGARPLPRYIDIMIEHQNHRIVRASDKKRSGTSSGAAPARSSDDTSLWDTSIAVIFPQPDSRLGYGNN